MFVRVEIFNETNPPNDEKTNSKITETKYTDGEISQYATSLSITTIQSGLFFVITLY
jgi:hypothetical protein